MMKATAKVIKEMPWWQKALIGSAAAVSFTAAAKVSTVEFTGEELKAMFEENLERTFSCDPYDQMGLENYLTNQTQGAAGYPARNRCCNPDNLLWRCKMEIPLQAQVEFTDGVCGRSVDVLIKPVIEQVTHLVVKKTSSPHTEVIVPVDLVSATIAGTIQVRCSKAELETMDPFVQTEFVKEKVPNQYAGNGGGYYGMGTYDYWPYVKRRSGANSLS